MVKRFERRLRHQRRSSLLLPALAVPLLILAGVLLWKVPQWQTPREITDPKERSELQDHFRRTGAEIILGGLAIAGLFLLWRRIAASERVANISLDHDTTDGFARAIEQLGNPSPAISLGGIYTLERIARASPRQDHWQVVEVLAAYVREQARWPGADHANGNGSGRQAAARSVPANVQAALTVLAHRDTSLETLEQRLNLSATDLRGADLEQASLQRADFTGANLAGARLGGAHLDGAILEGASLAEARLVGAHLAEARLKGASLAGAKLWDAQLQGADLQAANLEGACLGGANLSWARLWDARLEGADLKGAKLDGALGLPELEIAGINAKKPAKAAEPPQPSAHPAPLPRLELPAPSPFPGRRSQTLVYLNGIRQGLRRNGNGHSNDPMNGNGRHKDGMDDIPEEAPPEPEHATWGVGDEDS